MTNSTGTATANVGDMLNPDIDWAAANNAFQADRRVRVDSFLQLPAAEKIMLSMVQHVPWKLAILVNGEGRLYSPEEWRTLGAAKQGEILMAAKTAAQKGFHYIFEHYEMLAADDAQLRQTGLDHIAAFIQSERFVEIGRELTGMDDIVEADGQATRYIAGHYLTAHDDHQVTRRRAAYVMGFTPAWRPEWGGQLQFFDDRGDVTRGYSPSYNTLTVFAVRQLHAVSAVAPFAGGPRLSVTGWFLAKE